MATTQTRRIRELREATRLDVSNSAAHLGHVGDYEANGRDPRETPRALSRLEVFGIHVRGDFSN